MGKKDGYLLGIMAEAYRLHLLKGFERLLADTGFTRIAGVDEAGRGSLAGPVVAAAVVIAPVCTIPGVDDSKQLNAEGRSRLAPLIRARAMAYATASCSAATIDRVNVLEATRQAMSDCLGALAVRPQVALVDAVRLADVRYPIVPVVRGDSFSFAVACASILAKTERDRLMEEYDSSYPRYGFARNKGYGSAHHRRALEELGPTPIHRLTFRSVVPRQLATEN